MAALIKVARVEGWAMRIAVLGWGALIWNPQKLEVKGEFEIGGSPLPMEFTRVAARERVSRASGPAAILCRINRRET